MSHRTDFDFLPERAFIPRGSRLGKAMAGMTLEGGKGGNVSAPDPALIAAQVKSLGIQDEALQSIMDNSRALQPLQTAQMQFGLDSAKTAYEDAQADREYSIERRDKLSKQQDQLLQDATDFNEGSRADQLAAQAEADVTTSFDNSQAQQTRAMTRMGVTPGSGKFAAMSNQNAIAKATALAGASNSARTAARQEGFALTDRATNALAGYPSMSMQATGQGAQLGGLGLNYADQGLSGMNSGFQTGASVAGSSASGYGNAWGLQSQAYQASQANKDSWGSILGSVGGLATGAANAYATFSSARRPR